MSSENCLIRSEHESSENSRNFVLQSCSIRSPRDRRSIDFDNHSLFNEERAVLSTSTMVLIREARLNITSETAITGPFSVKKTISLAKEDCKSGFSTCGICGAVRSRNYDMKTRKFGIHSCEPCRKFILAMIKLSRSSYETLKCKTENGTGKCVINSGDMFKQKLVREESTSKSKRCRACWLFVCLQKYMFSNSLHESLSKLLPGYLRRYCYRKPTPHDSNAPNYNDSLKRKWFSADSFENDVGKELYYVMPRGPRIKQVCRSASSIMRASSVTPHALEEKHENRAAFSLYEPNFTELNDAVSDEDDDQRFGLSKKCSYGKSSDNETIFVQQCEMMECGGCKCWINAKCEDLFSADVASDNALLLDLRTKSPKYCICDKNNVLCKWNEQNRTSGIDHCNHQGRGRKKRKINFENGSTVAERKWYEYYTSHSKLDNPLKYRVSFKNIPQLDGMIDILNEEEEPVKCTDFEGEPLCTVIPSPSISANMVDQPSIKLNFISSSNREVAYGTFTDDTFAGACSPPQSFEIKIVAPPTYFIHPSCSKSEHMPGYVAIDDAAIHKSASTYLPQPTTTATLQFQKLPTAKVNFQPSIPTSLGTNMRSSVPTANSATASAAAAPTVANCTVSPQQDVILSSQPSAFGLEPVVHNMDLSSSQFPIRSSIGNEATKSTQSLDMPSGYVVLNPSSNISTTSALLPANVPQNTSGTAPFTVPLSAKLPQSVVTSCTSGVKTYTDMHANHMCNSNMVTSMMAKPTKTPIIRKQAKQPSNQAKKSFNIMKVKNNRPIAIEIKNFDLTTEQKPTIPLSTLDDEKMKNLQIKTTEKYVMLKAPVAQIQPVLAYPIAQSSNFNLSKAEPMLSDDVRSSCARTSNNATESPVQIDRVTQERVGLVYQSSNSHRQTSPKHEPQLLPISSVNAKATLPSSKMGKNAFESSLYPKLTSLSSSLRLPVSTTPFHAAQSIQTTVNSAARRQVSEVCNPSVPNSEPTPKKPISPVDATAPAPRSETEQLFDQLMRQHLAQERLRKRRAAEMVATQQLPVTDTSSTAGSSPVRFSRVQMSASKPLFDNVDSERGPPAQPVAAAAAAAAAEPSPQPEGSAVKVTRPYIKVKPRPQPRVPAVERGSEAKANPAAAYVGGASLPAAVAAKKRNKSPRKENEEAPVAELVVAPSNGKTAASVSFEVNAADGFTYKTNNLLDLWNTLRESVQQSRAKHKLPLLPKNGSTEAGAVCGPLRLEGNASQLLLEQLPDAWKCIFHKPASHKASRENGKTTSAKNETGCARSQPFASSYTYDMFGWLSSRHRKPPKLTMLSDLDTINGNRPITSTNLPMTMRFRHLKETAKKTVGVFRSDIHGRGLFCLREIDAGEMVIEYAGEVIRSTLTDKREKYYNSKGIGCYMFRIDDRYVVDATLCGNAARFINHSCQPNCYSRIVDIFGKKHILIFALRGIPKGEELTYDYKFPLEDDKIVCNCMSRKCRRYLN